MLLVDDDVFFVDTLDSEHELKFFQTSPYLNRVTHSRYGRLVYTTLDPFGSESICTRRMGLLWYKVVHKLAAGRRVSATTEEVLAVAAHHNYMQGRGLHRQLSVIPTERIVAVNRSLSAVDVYPEQRSRVLGDVAQYYDLSVEDLRLTGGAAVFKQDFQELGDLDVVVRVRNEVHLNYLLHSRKHLPGKKSVSLGPNLSISLGRRFSALRWEHCSGLIICPFFVYAGVTPPVVEAYPSGKRVSGLVKIIDTTHGIFNTQCFRCTGAVGKIVICSTIARGEMQVGMDFQIDCPLYRINQGVWAGENVAVVNAPYLDFAQRRLVGE